MLQKLIHLIQLLKNNFIALKAEVCKLDTAKLVNVPNSLNNLKTKTNDLDVVKLKTVPIDLKKIKLCGRQKSCEKHKIQHDSKQLKIFP